MFDHFYPQQIDECFKEKLEIVGDTYKGTSCAAGKTIKQSWKLDEETCMEGKRSFVFLNHRKNNYIIKGKFHPPYFLFMNRCFYARNECWNWKVQDYLQER